MAAMLSLGAWLSLVSATAAFAQAEQATPTPRVSPPPKAAKSSRKRQTRKRADKFDVMGPLLNEVGQELAELVGGDPEGVFLYLEVGRGWVMPSVFKAEGKRVRNFPAEGTQLATLLAKVWQMEAEGRRWSVMEYDVIDGRFAVTFRYPDEVDVEVIDPTRLQAALRARYGDRPVVYPVAGEEGI